MSVNSEIRNAKNLVTLILMHCLAVLWKKTKLNTLVLHGGD